MSDWIKAFVRLGGVLIAAALVSAGCSKAPEPAPEPRRALYRGYGFWFQDLAARFQKAVNPAGQPPRYELIRLPDFDPLASAFYQELAVTLSSVYPMTALSFGARASEMLQPMDVAVSNTAWVEEFARNGWLAPFDEAVVGPMLREAGVEPIRAVGPGDDPKSPRIYGVPIARAADLLFYRKSYFNNATEARQAWMQLFQSKIQSRVRETNEVNPKSKIVLPSSIAADGQEFFRFFLPLVWSLEPGWPRQAAGTFAAETPPARQVLDALGRQVQLETWPSAAARMDFLVDLKRQMLRFASEPSAAQTNGASPSAWLFSTWAQRNLITPWGPPAPLDDIGVMPLSVSTNAAAPGVSLLGGKCVICSRQIASDDPGAEAARETVQELVRYLLSEAGQRTMFFDQFEIPARRGLLQSLKEQDVAAVFGSRREWCSYEAYLAEVRAGTRRIDDRSLQFARQTLAMLREIEAIMNDPARLIVRSNPFSISRSSLLDGFLHKALAPKPPMPGVELPGLPEAAVVVETGGASAKGSLAGLQVLLEAEQRFMVPRAAPDVSKVSP
ncbi:MAG: extracellular solute-binding protein [Verrucomicrobia bacterium]|nr:extracellular solute-binding protein [Verrucomicrobiota bacterium]